MSWPLWFGVLLTAAALLTALGEIAARKGWISLFAARKGVHITVALCCAIAIEVVPMTPWFLGAVGVIVLALWYSVKQGVFSIDKLEARRSWGIFYFGLSFFLLILLFGQRSPWAVILGMAVMGFADASAALVGRRFPIPALTLGNEQKSWAGSAVFLIISLVLLFSIGPFQTNLSSITPWVLIGLMLWLTAVENSAGHGTDNLSVPLLFGWMYATMIAPDGVDEIQQRFVYILGPAALFAFLAQRSKSLTRDGAVTAASLGIVLFAYGSWSYVVPILVFFISGSFLSRALAVKEVRTEKGSTRDSWQVLANGGIPGLALLIGVYFDQPKLAYTMFLASLACATADTWATEWGVRFGGSPRHILTGRKMDPGLSGGVTLIGFLASLAGALLIAIIALLFQPFGDWFWWVVGFGFFGSVVDSLIGVFQAKFADQHTFETGSITELSESDGRQNQLISGYLWLNNDLVNAISSLVALIGAGLLGGAAL